MSVDVQGLLDEWCIHLRAQRKSPQTLKSYANGVRRYLQWCQDTGQVADLSAAQVNRFTVALLDDGNAAATVASRQLAVRRLSAWAAEEGILDRDDLASMRHPKIDTPVIEPLTEDELAALIKACAGRELRDRRDEAIVRLMAETGIRAGECASLALGDVDLNAGTAIVRRGKGGKGRIVAIGPSTCQAIARWLRIRKSHRLADTPALWLGDRGKAFNYDGLHKTLRARAEVAGIDRFHPHLLRHTAAHRWLAAGGSEGGLMAQAGWARPDMLMRYTRARAEQRAIAEARSLNLGEV